MLLRYMLEAGSTGLNDGCQMEGGQGRSSDSWILVQDWMDGTTMDCG